MLQDTQTPVKEYDPYEEALKPQTQNYDLFGKIEFNAWACGFTKGVRGGQPYDPAIHSKRHTMIQIYIQPLIEIDVRYPKTLEFEDVTWSVAWSKFTLPSLQALKMDNLREMNGKWARIARVPTGEKYEKKDAQGNPSGQMADITAFKFIAFYNSEDECRAAYLANGGKPLENGNGHNVPTTEPIPAPGDAERTTAYAFLKVIVTNAAKGKTTWQEAHDAVAAALTQYPTVAKYYTADSVETGELITETTKLLPY